MAAHLFRTLRVRTPSGRHVTFAACVVCNRLWPAGSPLFIEPCTEEAA